MDSTNGVVNEVEYSYNEFLQMTTEAQDHDGAVGSGTPEVNYEYEGGTSNTIRPTKVTYPGGEEVLLDYGTANGKNDELSRLEAVVRGPAGTPEHTLAG